MTTVVDPGLSPKITFNRIGTAIVHLTGKGIMSPVTIPNVSNHVIVLGTASVVVADVFQMSANFEIGDAVEFYWLSASGATVNDEVGNFISFYSGPRAALMRKVSVGKTPNWLLLR